MKKFFMAMVLSTSCYAEEVDVGEIAFVMANGETLTCIVVSTTPLMVSC
jgi:hypothetical protein